LVAADAVEARHLSSQWNVADPEKEKLDAVAGAAWQALPDENKAWVKVTGIIPFANIVALDDWAMTLLEAGTYTYPSRRTKGRSTT
jgi:hypothetical protein